MAVSLALPQALQWRKYHGSRYSNAAGPVSVGGPGQTYNKNILWAKNVNFLLVSIKSLWPCYLAWACSMLLAILSVAYM